MRKFWPAEVRVLVVVPGGPWRISGSAPQAELGAKRSSTWLKYARSALISTNIAWEGQVTRPGVDMLANVPTFDTCALPRLGSQGWCACISCLTRLSMHTVHSSRGRELSAGWAGSRNFRRDRSLRCNLRLGLPMAQRDSAR